MYKIKLFPIFILLIKIGMASLNPAQAMPPKKEHKEDPPRSGLSPRYKSPSLDSLSSHSKPKRTEKPPLPPLTRTEYEAQQVLLWAQTIKLGKKERKLDIQQRRLNEEFVAHAYTCYNFCLGYSLLQKDIQVWDRNFRSFMNDQRVANYNFEVLDDTTKQTHDLRLSPYNDTKQKALVRQFYDLWERFQLAEFLVGYMTLKGQNLAVQSDSLGNRWERLRVAKIMLRFDTEVLERRKDMAGF